MKQVLQSLRSGELEVLEVPAPVVAPGRVLVRNRFSFVSPGTERANREIARSSLLEKARRRPDQVKKVLRKIQTEGIVSTFQKVKSKLEEPVPLGYSCAGQVIAVGAGVEGIFPGDRVACAGAGYANHAEVVCVPKNLVVKVPDEVPFEDACAATLAAVALQGVRVADVRLGEIVGVVGLGLLGLLTLQILKANGCRTFGVDINPQSVERARAFGADLSIQRESDPEGAVEALTDGEGLDAVILTAAAESNDPVELAGLLCRKKGRVVAVGTLPLDVPRRVYYPKELELRISTSYGPGRYDPEYEERGHDYPIAYVRFTEQRNLDTVLGLMAEGKLRIAPLVTHVFPIEEAEAAYEIVEGKTGERALGILFRYGAEDSSVANAAPTPTPSAELPRTESVRVGVLGAGQFGAGVLLPKLAALSKVKMSRVVTARGATASAIAKRYDIPAADCDPNSIYGDPELDAVVIATPHHLHAEQVIESVRAGKHVFVEKPLALSREQLDEVRGAVESSDRIVTVGFNRRFSPLARQAADFLAVGAGSPIAMIGRINAGRLEKGSWLLDPEMGGGRVIGEVCHFIDLFGFWAGSSLEEIRAVCLRCRTGEENVSVLLRYSSGSTAALVYTAEGSPSAPKEYYELHRGGRSALLNDFRSLTLCEGTKSRTLKSRTQDKGHSAELEHFFASLAAGKTPDLTFQSCVETTEAAFAILDEIRGGR